MVHLSAWVGSIAFPASSQPRPRRSFKARRSVPGLCFISRAPSAAGDISTLAVLAAHPALTAGAIIVGTIRGRAYSRRADGARAIPPSGIDIHIPIDIDTPMDISMPDTRPMRAAGSTRRSIRNVGKDRRRGQKSNDDVAHL